MNKTTTKQWVDLIDERSKLLSDKRKAMRADDCNLSKNTKQTQTFALTKELKRLSVIKELLNNTTEKYEFSKEVAEFISSIVEPKGVSGTHVEVNAGDNFMNLVVSKYPDIKDAAAKIMKAAEKAGLVLNQKTGIYEAAK